MAKKIVFSAPDHGHRKVVDLEAHEMAKLENDAKNIINAYQEKIDNQNIINDQNLPQKQ